MFVQTKNDNALLNLVRSTLEDKKAQAITAYALSPDSAIADYFVIATGLVGAHCRALVEAVRMAVKDAGYTHPRTELTLSGGWMVLDAYEVVVHVFDPQERAFYDLDSLWSEHATPVWEDQSAESVKGQGALAPLGSPTGSDF